MLCGCNGYNIGCNGCNGCNGYVIGCNGCNVNVTIWLQTLNWL